MGASRPRHNNVRDDLVHVRRARCANCPFNLTSPVYHGRPENVNVLRKIEAARQAGTALTCHSTLRKIPGPDGILVRRNAVCRGYFDEHHGDSLALVLARHEGLLCLQEADGSCEHDGSQVASVDRARETAVMA